MILQRKVYKKLVSWKQESNGKTVLLIDGASGIGKTTICKLFAKENYKSFIILDLSKLNKRLLSILEKINDLDVFFQELQMNYNTRLHYRNSVIIFDGIQHYPKIRQALKHLVNDNRYDYIEIGSLIDIKENIKDISIVSQSEQRIKMYPLDFEEFLIAKSEQSLIDLIKTNLSNKSKLDELSHSKAMRLFYEYMVVGGLPQVIINYLKSRLDFNIAHKTKKYILDMYKNDIIKSSRKYRFKVSSLFDNIESFLSSYSKKVVLSDIGNGLTFDMYKHAFEWLESSMIANLCYKCDNPNQELSLNKNISFIKCYMSDTGLLVSKVISNKLISSNELYNSLMHGKISLFKGMIYENSIAQIISSSGYDLYCYYDNNNKIEAEFLIPLKDKLIPIEIKTAKNYVNLSYYKFKDMFKDRIDQTIIIHPKQLEYDGIVFKIPPYMLPFYLDLLKTNN